MLLPNTFGWESILGPSICKRSEFFASFQDFFFYLSFLFLFLSILHQWERCHVVILNALLSNTEANIIKSPKRSLGEREAVYTGNTVRKSPTRDILDGSTGRRAAQAPHALHGQQPARTASLSHLLTTDHMVLLPSIEWQASFPNKSKDTYLLVLSNWVLFKSDSITN